MPATFPGASLVDAELLDDGGVRKRVLHAPTGPSPAPGAFASIRYTLWLADGERKDGTAADAPLVFRLGSGAVVAGMDLAVASMGLGERSQVFIPYALGYGEEGNPPTIPARSDLYFDIELVHVDPLIAANTRLTRDLLVAVGSLDGTLCCVARGRLAQVGTEVEPLIEEMLRRPMSLEEAEGSGLVPADIDRETMVELMTRLVEIGILRVAPPA